MTVSDMCCHGKIVTKYGLESDTEGSTVFINMRVPSARRRYQWPEFINTVDPVG